MEVTREKMLSPIVFEVTAPRTPGEPVRCASSFYECFRPRELPQPAPDEPPPPQSAAPVAESPPPSDSPPLAQERDESSSPTDAEAEVKPAAEAPTSEHPEEEAADEEVVAAIAAPTLPIELPAKAADTDVVELETPIAAEKPQAPAEPVAAQRPVPDSARPIELPAEQILAAENDAPTVDAANSLPATAATVVDIADSGSLASDEEHSSRPEGKRPRLARTRAGQATEPAAEPARSAVPSETPIKATPDVPPAPSEDVSAPSPPPPPDQPPALEWAVPREPAAAPPDNARPQATQTVEQPPLEQALPPPDTLPTTPTVSGSESSSGPAPVAHVAPAPKPPPTLLRKPSESTSGAAPMDPARFLSRVVKAFESAQQRDGEVRLRLHPAELGSLRIDVKVLEGVLTAHVQAETPEARTALVDNLPVLRERLAEQGIRIDKFDVDLRDHSDRQPQQSQEHEQRANRPTAERMKTARPSIERETPRAPIVRGTSGASGLNVVV